MTASRIQGIRIAGIAGAVPSTTESVDNIKELFGNEEAEKIAASVGVKVRHIATANQCTSDFCCAAAEKLLSQLNWSSDSIDILIFVSQTPDYILPATSCSLHGRLGLSKKCAAFDLNLGCSGYVYGLWLAASLMQTSNAKRALLLAGETTSRIISPDDRSVVPLFGDGGTATAIEKSTSDDAMYFTMGTDGTGQDNLIVPAGGFRHKRTETTALSTVRDDGNSRSDEHLHMNGPEIFAFTLREVPTLVNQILAMASWEKETADAYIFHQANYFMLDYLAKRIKIPAEKFVIAMDQVGNTSSASIPFAFIQHFSNNKITKDIKLILAGFGVGYSWGASALTCHPTVIIPPIIKI